MRTSATRLTSCFLLWLLPGLPAQAQTRASLDTLVVRVDAFWKLLLQGKRLQAVEYVARSSREEFLARQLPAFSEPRLTSLEPSADRTEVRVTVIVKRSVPSLMSTVDWLVTERWVFRNRDWYLLATPGVPPMPPGTTALPSPPNADQVESRKRELRDALRFDKTTLDFGVVRKGVAASVSVKYTLDGSEALPITFNNSAADFGVRGLSDQRLQPGSARELLIEVPTSNYDGAVSERLILVAHREGVEVPFELTVQGQVYVPVSLSPRIVRFLTGEREKEVAVRNNSKSVLELKSVFSESGVLDVQPLPAMVSPGQEVLLKVKLAVEVSGANARDNLSLSFQHPVDGMSSLTMPVVLNYHEVKGNENASPISPNQIQELLRKTPPIAPR